VEYATLTLGTAASPCTFSLRYFSESGTLLRTFSVTAGSDPVVIYSPYPLTVNPPAGRIGYYCGRNTVMGRSDINLGGSIQRGAAHQNSAMAFVSFEGIPGVITPDTKPLVATGYTTFKDMAARGGSSSSLDAVQSLRLEASFLALKSPEYDTDGTTLLEEGMPGLAAPDLMGSEKRLGILSQFGMTVGAGVNEVRTVRDGHPQGITAQNIEHPGADFMRVNAPPGLDVPIATNIVVNVIGATFKESEVVGAEEWAASGP
jgi:hypothetical protein